MKCKKLFELRNCCLPELIRQLSHKHPAKKNEYNRLLKKSNPEDECKKVELAVLKGKLEASRNYNPVDRTMALYLVVANSIDRHSPHKKKISQKPKKRFVSIVSCYIKN